MSNMNGRFGAHGGQYIPETLMNAVIELEKAYVGSSEYPYRAVGVTKANGKWYVCVCMSEKNYGG